MEDILKKILDLKKSISNDLELYTLQAFDSYFNPSSSIKGASKESKETFLFMLEIIEWQERRIEELERTRHSHGDSF